MEVDVLNFSGKYVGDTFEVSGVIGRSTSDGGTQFGSSSWWIPATDEGGKIGDPASLMVKIVLTAALLTMPQALIKFGLIR